MSDLIESAGDTAPATSTAAPIGVRALRLVAPGDPPGVAPVVPVSEATIALLEQLLDLARRGEVIGLAFAAAYQERRYITVAVGVCKSDPEWTARMLVDLVDDVDDLPLATPPLSLVPAARPRPKRTRGRQRAVPRVADAYAELAAFKAAVAAAMNTQGDDVVAQASLAAFKAAVAAMGAKEHGND
jgi:hypothetical protein